MFFAAVFAAYAMFCCFVVYCAISIRRLFVFLIGPPRFEPFDHAAEMEEVIGCLTGVGSIQIDEMRLGEKSSEWTAVHAQSRSDLATSTSLASGNAR
jgi:hypothetical protein